MRFKVKFSILPEGSPGWNIDANLNIEILGDDISYAVVEHSARDIIGKLSPTFTIWGIERL